MSKEIFRMKIIHTSDWHLGRRLCGQERTEEFKNFLEWLSAVIGAECPDALIVAGDVFDTYTPPLWAQSLYFNFLTKLSASRSGCSVVIVAGNHDSAALLDIPREVLKSLNVFVVGEKRSPEEEVVQLKAHDGTVGALCCAVPFLRSRDLCGAMAGETPEAIKAAELEGFRTHYEAVVAAAEAQRAKRDIPIIAMGHCFVAGSQARDDDGVRDLSVGSIDAVPADVFPENIDYLALGHLHLAQTCGSRENYRYSGAPLCMGFGEAGQKKYILVVDFDGRKASIRPVPVPEFQKIRRVRGSFDEIAAELANLTFSWESVWAEAECTDEGARGLNDRIRQLVPENGPVKLLRVKVPGVHEGLFSGSGDLIEDWSPKEIFKLFLREHELEGTKGDALMTAYLEALDAVLKNPDKKGEGQ